MCFILELPTSRMTEFVGRTAAYMTAPRVGCHSAMTCLPSISAMQSSYQPYDTFPAPAPLRRSITSLPYRASTYYGSGPVNSAVAHAWSMPEAFNEQNRLGELDSIKVG